MTRGGAGGGVYWFCDIVQYDRLNFVVKNGCVRIIASSAPEFLDGFLSHFCDHWLVYNDGFEFKPQFSQKCATLEFEEWSFGRGRREIFAEINSYHFPVVKSGRADYFSNAILDPRSEINAAFAGGLSLDEVRKSELIGTRIDPAMLDGAKILRMYDGFAWDKAGYEKP